MQFACPHCKHYYTTQKAQAGMHAKCKYCGQIFTIKKSRLQYRPPTPGQVRLLQELGIQMAVPLDKRQTTALLTEVLKTEKYSAMRKKLPPTQGQLEMCAQLKLKPPKGITRLELVPLIDAAMEAEHNKRFDHPRDDRGRFTAT